jgi:antitoxin PrlF
MSKCMIEALVTMDGRGQIVIPKKVRESTGIRGGEKLVVCTNRKEGRECYIFLVKTGNFPGIAGSFVNKNSLI